MLVFRGTKRTTDPPRNQKHQSQQTHGPQRNHRTKEPRVAAAVSSLMPNSSVTTYAVPSDHQLGHGGSVSDEAAKVKRVQQQVQMRLAERSSGSLPRTSTHQYGTAELNGSSTLRYHTYNPGFSSVSLAHIASRTKPVARVSQYSGGGGGFSSRSAVEIGTHRRMSTGAPLVAPGQRPAYHFHDDTLVGSSGGGGGGGYHTASHAHYQQQQQQQQQQSRVVSRAAETQQQEVTTLRQPSPVPSWAAREGLTSERYVYYSGAGGGGVGVGTLPNPAPMQRTLSGTLARGGWREPELIHQYSFKGPAQRTLSRFSNYRHQHHQQHQQQQQQQQFQQQQQMNRGTLQYQQVASGGGSVHGQSTIRRAGSLHSLRSVGKGGDILDGDACGGSDALGGMQNLDMPTAVSYLGNSDVAMQMLGAAYIQHQCYHSTDAKSQVRQLKGIPALVELFSSESQEVQRYATGATRNLIYENMDNKTVLIQAGGIGKLMEALGEPDDELRKNITGILWNLSSKDNLKEKLAKETLSELTEKVLVPLSGWGDAGVIQQTPSEADIFYNTTGCLRNLSSVSGKTRQQMRETRGLVDSLVAYVQNSLEEGKAEDKGVENCVCVLRNLSYQLYSELPPSVLLRLEGPTRGQDTQESTAIGCFTPQSKKAKEKNQELSTLSEVARQPKGAEWLWHPLVLGLYSRVLQACENNAATREAAAGALQNVTAGDSRWASVLSRVALEQERLLPVVLDQLRTQSDVELRSLTGLLRNLSRHGRNKDDMATKVVNILVTKLPSDGHQKQPSGEVVVNICGTLNNLVAGSSLAARDITFFGGLPKLVAIKTSHDNSPGKLKAAKAASTVLSNMFQYSKLHKDYKQKGFTKQDFVDPTL
ncbi:plakophilin-3 isoform X2 [Alosa sapidissima]|uniref:plakophilin-3 isoform X2 n=1 Tax=Alosa sapidissima TaxID=34773 RepID=UPI001C09DBCC|nr:plakophilin-3 isoform X2 [Alosa sapidissima]